jgi:hypothetical protein
MWVHAGVRGHRASGLGTHRDVGTRRETPGGSHVGGAPATGPVEEAKAEPVVCTLPRGRSPAIAVVEPFAHLRGREGVELVDPLVHVLEAACATASPVGANAARRYGAEGIRMQRTVDKESVAEAHCQLPVLEVAPHEPIGAEQAVQIARQYVSVAHRCRRHRGLGTTRATRGLHHVARCLG